MCRFLKLKGFHTKLASIFSREFHTRPVAWITNDQLAESVKKIEFKVELSAGRFAM